jgi:peptidoglycan hydrolase-like protein with peptidoglycan-binding domain
VAYGHRDPAVRRLQLRLRAAIGAAKAKALNPAGATGYYGTETRAMVRYALRGHPETWDRDATHHDGDVGPRSWSVIDKL